MLKRRGFLLGLGLVATPAIIRPGVLMPVKPLFAPVQLDEPSMAIMLGSKRYMYQNGVWREAGEEIPHWSTMVSGPRIYTPSPFAPGKEGHFARLAERDYNSPWLGERKIFGVERTDG